LSTRRLVEALLINAVLILALLWVTGEQSARASYAVQRGLTFSVTRSLFTYVTTLSSSSGQLSSPPTLDWIQVIVFALFLIDLYYVYGAVRRRGKPD
jgi:hypothetical protein